MRLHMQMCVVEDLFKSWYLNCSLGHKLQYHLHTREKHGGLMVPLWTVAYIQLWQ